MTCLGHCEATQFLWKPEMQMKKSFLLLKHFQWLVICQVSPVVLQLGLSKAFSNGLFLQRKKKKVNGNVITAFSEHLTKVDKKQ